MTITGTAAKIMSDLTHLLQSREDVTTYVIMKLGDAKSNGEAWADNDSLTSFTKVRITYRSTSSRDGEFTLETACEGKNTLSSDGTDNGSYPEELIWGILDKYGFEPGYQELMVTEAAEAGEHWSYTEDGEEASRHLHLTSSDDGTSFTVRVAGSECTHADA